MSNDLTKRAGPTAPKQAEDAASRLKSDLMQDALGCMCGEYGEKQAVPGNPRVIFAHGWQAHSGGWDRASSATRSMTTRKVLTKRRSAPTNCAGQGRRCS